MILQKTNTIIRAAGLAVIVGIAVAGCSDGGDLAPLPTLPPERPGHATITYEGREIHVVHVSGDVLDSEPGWERTEHIPHGEFGVLRGSLMGPEPWTEREPLKGSEHPWVRAWGRGEAPHTNLSGIGTAKWSGQFIGVMNPSFEWAGSWYPQEKVFGSVDLMIYLQTLNGEIFFNVEPATYHIPEELSPPTSLSLSIIPFEGGEYKYDLEVIGNAFYGADNSGTVTGAFVGNSHQGAVGVFEHRRFTGAFGANR